VVVVVAVADPAYSLTVWLNPGLWLFGGVNTGALPSSLSLHSHTHPSCVHAASVALPGSDEREGALDVHSPDVGGTPPGSGAALPLPAASAAAPGFPAAPASAVVDLSMLDEPDF
jgi:hypothetical protein